MIFIDGLRVNYKLGGSGGPLVLILHGWGGSSDSWKKIIAYLEPNFQIICPDLPGFGKSETPKNNWNLSDYAIWLKKFTEIINTNNFFLLGHSFGGRIAIKFSISWPQKIKALLLCSSAGIKQKWSVKEKIIWITVLIGNSIFSARPLNRFRDKARHLFYKLLKNKDYTRANETMKEIMKKVISEDLTPELSKISTKTFIIWGAKDNIVPIADAYIFKAKIKNSKLTILPNIRHSPHLEDPKNFAEIIKKLILTSA